MDKLTYASKSFEQALAEGKLIGSKCNDCGALITPQRLFCSKCGSMNTEVIEFSGKGKLAAFTVIYVASSPMANLGYGPKNPYCSGIVELEEGPRISAQITGFDLSVPASIKIGAPLEFEVVTVGEGEEVQHMLTFKKS